MWTGIGHRRAERFEPVPLDGPAQEYVPATWGPKRFMELIELEGRRWLHAGNGEGEPICGVFALNHRSSRKLADKINRRAAVL